MNHLKYIRGINVSRRAPSSATLPSRYGQHIDDVYFENRQFRSQLSGSDPLFVAKRNHGTGIKYSEQFRPDGLRLISKESKTIYKQRSRTKSSVTSLKKKSSMDKKKLPLESVAKTVCHYSTCQNIKFNSSGINKRINTPQSARMVNNARNINRHNSFVASVEKHPRSYAEMIAAYSEDLYKRSSVGIPNDSLHFNNAIHKSPFSTLSTPSSAKKMVNFAKHSEVPIEGWKNYSFPPVDTVKTSNCCTQHDNINSAKCHDSQYHDTCGTEIMNKSINQDCIITNDLKNDQSYAKLIADYSKSMHDISFANISNSSLPTRNVLARNSLESVVTPIRKVSSTNTQETLQKVSPTVALMPFEKNINEQTIDLKKNDWLREIDNVMSDLKSITRKKTIKIMKKEDKTKGSDILYPVDMSCNSPDRVHRLTELIKAHERKEKDTAIKELSHQSDKIDNEKDFELQKTHSQLSNKISDPPRYFSTTAKSSPARKNSIHMPTSAGTSILKQPQVKLRMVPSEKESVVSINVDSASVGLSDPPNSASKQLSVVVQSDQMEDPQSTEIQRNASTFRRSTKSASRRSDFGPMRISISEDSAPVKQIEFSINGKPVSELKSITARTERLDVVSSVDKIEIRIPFAKDESNTLSKIGEGDLSRGIDSNLEQILNVQILANFQNEPRKVSAERPAETTRYQHDKNTIPTSSSSISKTHLFNDSMKAREETINSNNMQQYGSFHRMDIKSDMIDSVNKHKTSDVDLKIQRNAATKLSADKTTTDISSIEEANSPKVRNLNMKTMMSATRFPKIKKYDKNESSDHRIPSKIIPWWSSSDSFNKIKKKEDDRKPHTPPSNRNGKNATSNLNQNLVIKSVSSKSKQTSNPKTLTKKTQSMDKTTVTTNNSNLFSHSNSVERRVESKPTTHQSSTLKPSWGNLLENIPEIVRNDFKTNDNQTSAIKESNKKASKIEQVEPVTFDTMNVRTYAPNLSSKGSQEKKDNNSLNQTKSINNVQNTRSKIENISDDIKSVEKKEDGTLIDYNLKMSSRKPTVKLNSKVKEVQYSSPVTIKTKDIVSTEDMVPKGEQFTKTISARQTESNKTKMDILKEKEDLIVNNIIATDIKVKQNKNDIKNIKQSDAMTSNTSNLRNSSKLKQTLKKQEKLAEDTIVFQDNSKQNLKSLSEHSKDKCSSLSSAKISSGTIQKSDKLGISVKIPSEESQQNKQKSIKNSGTFQESERFESEKFRNLFSKLEDTPSKEFSDKKMIDQKKSSLETISEIQTKTDTNTNTINKMADINKLSYSQIKSNPVSKIKDHTVPKNLMEKFNKNVKHMSITDQSAKKLDKVDAGNIKIVTQNPKSKNPLSKDQSARKLDDKIDAGNIKTVMQNPKSKNPLSKDYEESRLNKWKSGKDKENPSGSAGSSRKPSGLTGSKSADSNMKSRVMSNDNCTYTEKLLFMESLYSNFDRKDNTISNVQPAMFKISRNLNNIDNTPGHHAPSVIGNTVPWTDVDRPEKSMLYSAWLQRSRNDINKNEKLL